MRPHVCIIDPAMKEPAAPCLNQLMAKHSQFRYSYHLPAIVGTKTLRDSEKPDAIVVLGSASFATDDLPWQLEVFEYVKHWLYNKVPTLGICFGHQLVAKGFESKIRFISEDKQRRVGVRPITFSESFGDIQSGETLMIATNHRQEVHYVPSEIFKPVANSNEVVCEAIRHEYLPFWSFQGHPEASKFFMSEYIGGLSSEEMSRARTDGDRIITNFFKVADLDKGHHEY